jgi:CheY-like chemotaxis protein
MRSKPTILYVEDDPNDAVVFERALKKSGLALDLQMTHDGMFALEYLNGEEQFADRETFPLPQIILTDMKMFRMGGIELLEWVRKSRKFCDLPVVLFSTSSEDIDVNQAMEAGATAYFRKTYQCLDVIAFLRKWLGEQKGKTAAKDTVKPTVAKVRMDPSGAQPTV